MDRLRFYLSKINMLAHFIWWRNWPLVREEWNVTYQGLVEARARLPEIEKEVLQRILKAIDDEESKGTGV